MDCNHAIGEESLRRYLTDKANSGPFPIYCPSCLSTGGGNQRGIITESPLCGLVAAGVITDDLKMRIIRQHILLNPDQASLELEFRSSKACPFCSTRISHYKGHACHHIMPGGGCPSCHKHFCYNCLGYKEGGVEWQGCPNHCSTFCNDNCSCPICPDCSRGTPCRNCDYPSASGQCCRACNPL